MTEDKVMLEEDAQVSHTCNQAQKAHHNETHLAKIVKEDEDSELNKRYYAEAERYPIDI